MGNRYFLATEYSYQYIIIIIIIITIIIIIIIVIIRCPIRVSSTITSSRKWGSRGWSIYFYYH